MGVLETIRSGFRTREPRIPVHVRARMRVSDRWADITIHNVSSRGLMARCAGTPAPGAYVEIRRGTDIAIIGRIVWRKGPSFGLRAQDPIDIATLLGHAGDRRDEPHDPTIERRAAPRAARLSPEEAHARAQRTAARLQFIGVLLLGCAGAALAAKGVANVLGAPLAEVARNL